ncbi:MAG: WD40 repeat domain-containing protein, partial [Moorea sp. SIO4E2]|nr:WD40 repeat domain-containing protein [Moorena sp. SIO4E2]
MSINAWPFLVSRNRYLDYRTVVAPDFICDAKIANLLARVTDGDLTEPGKGFIRQIAGTEAGDFTIVFRIIQATEKDLNSKEGDDILKDEFGRKIYLIEGVVIQGIKSK